MVQVEQTEFWSDVDVKSSPAATTSFTRRNTSIYVDETASLTNWFLDETPEDGEELPMDVVEPASATVEELEPEPERLPVSEPSPMPVARRAPTELAEPTFNMARFLTLTGSLDSVEESGRYLVLPRGSFRARVMLDAVRRISQDFLKDLRSPPRSYSIAQYQRPSGWMRL